MAVAMVQIVLPARPAGRILSKLLPREQPLGNWRMVDGVEWWYMDSR